MTILTPYHAKRLRDEALRQPWNDVKPEYTEGRWWPSRDEFPESLYPGIRRRWIEKRKTAEVQQATFEIPIGHRIWAVVCSACAEQGRSILFRDGTTTTAPRRISPVVLDSRDYIDGGYRCRLWLGQCRDCHTIWWQAAIVEAACIQERIA